MLVESTDVLKQMIPWQIARKSIVSSVSDMSAKGISSPFYSLISLGIPRTWTKNKIKNLVLGFKKASKEFGITFLGGDTNESKELVIDCVLLGFRKSNFDIPKRSGAIEGDLIIVSGEFGYSSAGLNILLNNSKADGNFKKKAVKSVLRPLPRQKFGKVLCDYFTSSIDSSDGLSTSLYELANQSKVDFLIDNLPMPGGLEVFSKTNSIDLHDLIFNGGEEYEIVATVKRSMMKKINTISKKFGLKVIVIGQVKSGRGRVFVKSKKIFDLTNLKNKNMVYEDYYLLENKGYMHFL
jgi:thiamine-monophosphate kinase